MKLSKHEQRHLLGTPEEAAAKPARSKNDPESITNKLRRHGFSHSGVQAYRRRHPDSELTDDEIIQQMIERRERRQKIDAAVRDGIPRQTIYYRQCYQGMTLDEACNTPLMTKSDAGRISAALRNGKEVA
ncbi:hypothetical protein [Halomonas caseinilytica]|uniref:hypothetical protein n=1 Tax=Halomonas caseinilytica TaxID=438744 RepID=UPI0007E579D3|nr:hypothetical protein [Halomonas caseinilytica]SEN66158.1 hypothetical protein SAMN04487952_12338 [Halomonas caseinilytica]